MSMIEEPVPTMPRAGDEPDRKDEDEIQRTYLRLESAASIQPQVGALLRAGQE